VDHYADIVFSEPGQCWRFVDRAPDDRGWLGPWGLEPPSRALSEVFDVSRTHVLPFLGIERLGPTFNGKYQEVLDQNAPGRHMPSWPWTGGVDVRKRNLGSYCGVPMKVRDRLVAFP